MRFGAFRSFIAGQCAGRGWRLSYESELFVIGSTVQVMQADGSRVIFSRDATNPSRCASTDHRLIRATGPGCTSCAQTDRAYGYDALGRLVSTSRLDAQGHTLDTVRSERDGLGRVVRIERVEAPPTGRQARLLAQRTQAQLIARYEYPADRELDGRRIASFEPSLIAEPSVIPGREHQWRIERNEAGQITRRTERGYSPLDQGKPGEALIERTTTYTYQRLNGRSLLAGTDGPLANGPKNEPSDSDITRFEWDDDGRHITSIQRPGALVTQLQRDEAGRLIATTEPGGITTRITTRIAYAQALQASRIERAGRVTSYTYDAQGRTERIAEAGNLVALAYDAAGRLNSVTDAEGHKAQVAFDADGLPRVAGLYEPGQDQPLRATYRGFDDHRRLTQQLRPDGRLDTWAYDSAGRLVEHTDGDDVRHLQSRQAKLDLSPDGLVRLSTQSDRSDPTQPSTRRDDFGRVVMQWRPEQGLSLRTYDAADRLIQEQRLDRKAKPAGQAEYAYDPAGQLTERRHTEGDKTTTTTRRYEHGRLVEEANEAETRSYGYDDAGRVERTTIAIKDGHGKTAYTTTLQTSYDQATGAATTRTLADGHVLRIERNAHHASGLALQSPAWARWHERLAEWLPVIWAAKLQAALPTQPIASRIAATPFDGITGYASGNGAQTARRFDIAGRLTSLKVGAQAQGQAQGQARGIVQQTLAYQVGPRVRKLDEESDGTPSSASYDYTGFGALKTEARPVKTSASNTALELDDRGRVASDGQRRYRYTEAGQIEAVTTLDGQAVASYRYNSRHQRVAKQLASGQTTYYLWQDDLLVAEIEGGQITSQYLYLGNAGRYMPIAKLEAANAQGNRTGKERTLFIHTGHRNEPVAMTDTQQHVVWKARPDAWGYIEASAAEGQQAQLNLRLPGQYFDAETGLHDNHHRSYDPRPNSQTRGRYLSPDPLGYVDGPDPYLYASGDPINSADPQGLYQSDIHYYMTFVLALVAGVPYDTARTIALAAQYIDDNPATRPLDEDHPVDNFHNPEAIQRLLTYHFVLVPSQADPRTGQIDTSNYGYAPNTTNIQAPSSAQLTRLMSASAHAPTRCAQAQFFGEYLHAFEDTFAHRDATNHPYGILDGIGHGYDLSHPDYTYSDDPNYQGTDELVRARIWAVRPERTLEMEREVFDRLGTFATANGHEFSEIEADLRRFNATTQRAEGRTPEEIAQNIGDKLDVLQEILNRFEINDPQGNRVDLRRANGAYDPNEGDRRRNRNLCSGGARLNQADYPGTILPEAGVPCQNS